MSKKTIIAAFIALLLGTALKAQTYDITGIKRINPNDLNAIIENNEIKGYYAFYFLDKEGKKQNLYNLAILDNNLKQTYSVEMKKSDKLRLLESSYNGERFCFTFVDAREKVLEYMVLDKTGKTVGTYTLQISKTELGSYGQGMTEDDNFAGGLAAIKNKGFLRIGMEKKDGMKVEFEMIDNNGVKKWEANSGFETDGKSYESANFLYADDKTAVMSLTTRGRKLSTKGMETYLSFYNIDSGKEMFKVDQKNDKYQISCLGVSYDESTATYFSYGQYWALADNMSKDDSKGMYITEIGTDGKIKKENYSTWTGDINNILLTKAKKKYEDNTKTFIHKVVRTADGKVFAVGEMYRKAVSGWGVASKILSGGGGGGMSAMKMILYDMVVFEFDPSFKIKDVTVVEKEKTNLQLPEGWGMLDANRLSLIMKMLGWFDYSYTIISSDRKQFNSAYVNFDREKGSSSNYVVGNIAYTKDQKVVSDKIRLKDDPTRFWVMPAKPGYVVIFEYFRKKKTATFRMEKLNL
ncbi:MAG TPA: DUF6770 family protein [Bacteroidia bacterium]|nr:DUF6770 family protein [Bacteroidia bacterium]